ADNKAAADKAIADNKTAIGNLSQFAVNYDKNVDQINQTVVKNTQQIQNNSLNINKLSNSLNKMNSRIEHLDNKIEDGLAKSAALNGLFQPYGVGKMNISTAVGGYGNKQAIAVGMGYQFNETVAAKSGISISDNGKTMYNVGVNIEW
ncbi:YadA C-terminal domain-containing protein, partial [Providencia alcalifaciens]|uniref:YadA C-terminal domain-containing protein n=1 Tax=Providencia alcalifaciens TaxID=126385 RepID=UPI00044AC128